MFFVAAPILSRLNRSVTIAAIESNLPKIAASIRGSKQVDHRNTAREL